jgi:hypothetical protein
MFVTVCLTIRLMEGTVELVNEEYNIHLAHRVKRVDIARLAELSGVPTDSLCSAL